ncbi:MAG TPA: hemolysin family protein [Syntrophales bacterium]|nr:hemolysin family protein [Syntrophales bacterium]
MLYFEILAVLVLILLNGLLAMSELAVVSSRKSRLEQLAKRGSRGARAAIRLADDPGRFLSTVQIGITLVGIFAGAFSGATLGRRLGGWLETFPSISPYGDALGIGVTIVGITYLSLILGELVPKRVALARPERIASLVAGPMQALSLIAAPAVWALHVSTERVLHALGLHGPPDAAITEEEVKSLIAEGTRAGVFARQEQEMIEGVLRMADRSVRVIMTPRSKIVWVDAGSDRDAVLATVDTNRFSRLLVCEGSIDRPVGFIHSRDLLPEALRGGRIALSASMQPLLFVPERLPILQLLGRFKREKVHIAVVVDEYGTTEGIVTLTDVIEAIAGDLPERGENDEPRIVRKDDSSWLIDGMFPTDEVEAVTGIPMGRDVKMMAAYVLDSLGRIPETGTCFHSGNARFTVVDMDGNRIDKVLVEIDRDDPDRCDGTAGP